MRTISITFLMFFVVISSSAQEQNDLEDLKKEVPQVAIPFSKILDREFTRILTGQGTTNFGTSATLGIDDEIANLNGHIPISNKNSIGINFKGGVTEGISSLLNGENVNSNISFGLQFNFGIYNNSKNEIRADATQLLNFKYSIDSLILADRLDSIEIINSKQKLEYELEINNRTTSVRYKTIQQHKKTIEQENKKIKILNQQLLLPNFSEISQQDSLKKLILKSEIAIVNAEVAVSKAEKEILDLEKKKVSIIYLLDRSSEEENLRKIQNIFEKSAKKYNNEVKKIRLIGYKLKWFSIYSNLNNRTFNLLDISEPFESQVTKTSFNQFEFGLNYNIYRLINDAFKSYYLSFGVSYVLDDNFGDLSKTTIKEQQEIGTAPNSRIIENTKTVYIGEYEDDVARLSLNSDFYWFLSYKQTLAFHMKPSIQTDFDDSRINNLLGFLVGFKNNEKENNIINVELFYDMIDVFKDSEGDDDELTDRSTLGIRLNFPIYFNQALK